MLAENEAAIDLHVKDSAGSRDQLRLDATGLLDGGRQTGGAGQVVSLRAVGDADFHRATPVSGTVGFRS
jgi:hypothetical protein